MADLQLNITLVESFTPPPTTVVLTYNTSRLQSYSSMTQLLQYLNLIFLKQPASAPTTAINMGNLGGSQQYRTVLYFDFGSALQYYNYSITNAQLIFSASGSGTCPLSV
jgi:hypothetical protein